MTVQGMNIREIMQQATLELVKSTQLKQRLVSCFTKYLQHINDAELPPALRSELNSLRSALVTAEPLPGETPVLATVRKLSFEETERFAHRVVVLFGDIANGLGEQLTWAPQSAAPVMHERRRVPRPDHGENVVPLFAALEG